MLEVCSQSDTLAANFGLVHQKPPSLSSYALYFRIDHRHCIIMYGTAVVLNFLYGASVHAENKIGRKAN